MKRKNGITVRKTIGVLAIKNATGHSLLNTTKIGVTGEITKAGIKNQTHRDAKKNNAKNGNLWAHFNAQIS
jgi:hypothetical protein